LSLRLIAFGGELLAIVLDVETGDEFIHGSLPIGQDHMFGIKHYAALARARQEVFWVYERGR
jgi:hypothetical protein